MKKAQLSLEFILLIIGILLVGTFIAYQLSNMANTSKFAGNISYTTKKTTYRGFELGNIINNTTTTNTGSMSYINESSETLNETNGSNYTFGYAKIWFLGINPPTNESYITYDDIKYTNNIDIFVSKGSLIIKPKGNPDQTYILYPTNGIFDYQNLEFWAQGRHTIYIYNVKTIPENVNVTFIIKGNPVPQVIMIKDVKDIKGLNGISFKISGGGNKTNAKIYIYNTTIDYLNINKIERTSGDIHLIIENSNIKNLIGYPYFSNYYGKNTIIIDIENSWINGDYVTSFHKEVSKQ